MTCANRIGKTEILPSHWFVTPSVAPVPLDHFKPARRLPRNLFNINDLPGRFRPLASIPTTWEGKAQQSPLSLLSRQLLASQPLSEIVRAIR